MSMIEQNIANLGADPFQLARRMRTPVWVYDTDCQRVAYANIAACEIWGAQDETELRARDLAKGMSETVASRLKQYQSDFIDRDAEFTETWTIHPNGEPVTLDVVYTGFTMPDGRMAMMCEVVGAPDQTTETLRSTKALLHTDVLIALFSHDGAMLYQNPAARTLLTVANHGFENLFVDEDELQTFRKEWETRGDSRNVVQIKTSLGRGWFDVSVKRCLDAASGEQALLITAFDVSELKTTRDRARFLASRDQLTGAYNRAFMQTRLEELSRREGLAGHALLYIDIDKFKSVNDTHGHEAGDAILCAAAERIHASLQDEDILARMGGDEFVVLLSNVEGQEWLASFLDELSACLKAPITVGELKLSVTPSIGMTYLEHGLSRDWSKSLKQADLALYHAKRQGRDQYALFDASIGAEADERTWLERELKTAIINEEFEIYYQPRIELETNKVVASEALLRWFHPERGYIPPQKYIPICEEIGLIDKLGTCVLKRAADQVQEWQNTGFDMNVSVNVSPVQFKAAAFVEMTEKIASRSEKIVSKLELEITESSLTGDEESAFRQIERIEQLGYQIALDDFGTGYSNLAHISRFPVQCIKLDRSFVSQLPKSGPLISLIFALAKQINARVVAEGVETAKQLTWLKRRGCEEVQGFYFSQAVPAHELRLVAKRIANGLSAAA